MLRRARLLVSGSAPLPVPVFEKLRELTGQAPVERYGMSETMITLSVRADGERRPGWVGVPVAGVETRLVSTDEETDGELLPHDGESIGELQVRGPGLFDGYLGRPEATADTWTDGRLVPHRRRRGDRRRRLPPHRRPPLGRPHQDRRLPGRRRRDRDRAARARRHHARPRWSASPTTTSGQRIVAHVVLAGDPVDPEEVIAFVAERLSAHKRPREVRVVDALPRNAMGKVQKARL